MERPSGIRIVGAREHNLRNLTVTIPKNQLVVITGPSGSGKSSLAFDTLYAEGQRRFVQSLSSHARQFIEQLDRPAVDRIDGLAPAVAIEQRRSTAGNRSTIATATEIADFLRLLFASAGQAHHPVTGKPLLKLTTSDIAERIEAEPTGTRFILLAPLVRSAKGRHTELLDRLRQNGYARVRIDGTIHPLDHLPQLAAGGTHDIDVVIDRLKVAPDSRRRLMDSLELALRVGKHVVIVLWPASGDQPEREWKLSNRNYDPESDTYFPEWKARDFSFNHPHGACPGCQGLGTIMRADPGLVVPDPSLPLSEMAVAPWRKGNKALLAHYKGLARDLARHAGIDLDTPWSQLPASFHDLVLRGSGSQKLVRTQVRKGEVRETQSPFEGVLSMVETQYRNARSPLTRRRMQSFMNPLPCPACAGARLRPEILSVRIAGPTDKRGLNIHEVGQLPIRDCRAWLQDLEIDVPEPIAHLHREIRERIGFLDDVGLGYLSLNRETASLSGGEFQRIRLATQLGSALTGVLYVLDEPSIGLHPADHARLIESLLALRDQENSVVVVEHDEETMQAADWIIDLGPGAGPNGGQIIAEGSPRTIAQSERSITGRYLAGKEPVRLPVKTVLPGSRWVTVRGAREHNLQDVDATFPIGCLTCVTGVSGSGKSTLVNRILAREVFRRLYRAKDPPGEHDGIDGLEHIDRAVVVNQNPIGRSPRSNPATYTGIFDDIRTLFAGVPASRIRGYTKSRFSFNTPGGRCEKCQGDGQLKIEMNFMPDAFVTCDACEGSRYNRETLEITYRDHSIADVLGLSVDEAHDLFIHHPKMLEKLESLQQVGLGYLRLGQSANSLSGGEAQRVKLAAELSRNRPDHALFLLDEPTTGLHFDDVRQLLRLLFRLRDAGNTLVIIEHHLDVIRHADHLIDLGPGGGDLGGRIIATGTPESLAARDDSPTGKCLARSGKIKQIKRLTTTSSSNELF